MASTFPQLQHPKPRRPYDSPAEQASSPLPPATPDETPSRTHSILNLTSSTLQGIYAQNGYYPDREEPFTPWGTGPESLHSAFNFSPRSTSPPSHRRKLAAPVPTSTSTIFSLALRSVLLFGIGMSYGLLVRHLHDDRQLAPFQVEGIIKPRNDWRYFVFWGVSGVALGSLLPWVDGLWEENFENAERERERSQTPDGSEEELDSSGLLGADWTPVIRSVGAFIGIAFAIRKLPWASNLQASFTLFLVNPVLWYIIDRSTPGFFLSSSVGALGTALLLASNPGAMPSPTVTPRTNFTIRHSQITNDDMGGLVQYVSRENIEGGVWILSVLFCSCVCFGNVGRRLALRRAPTKVSKSSWSSKLDNRR